MLKTIENNGVILIDPQEETKVVAELLLRMNAFISIPTAEIATTMSEAMQYRERNEGRFPQLVNLNHHGRRKAYRIQELAKWLEDPLNYQCSDEDENLVDDGDE